MDHIHKYIKDINSGILPDVDTDNLKKLIADYPCFHSAYALKAVYLNQQEPDVLYDELPSLAIHVRSRTKLYDLTHASYYTKKILPVEEVLSKENKTNEMESSTPTVNELDEIPTQEAEEIIMSDEPVADVEIEDKELQNEPTESLTTSSEKIDTEIEAIIQKAEKQSAESINNQAAKVEHEPSDIENNTKKDKEKDTNDVNELVKAISEKKERQPIVTKVEKKKTKKPKAKTKKIKKAKKSKQQTEDTTESSSFLTWLKNKNQQQTSKPLSKAKKEKKEIKGEKKTPPQKFTTSKESVPIDPAAAHEAILYKETKNSSFKLEDFLINQIEKKQKKTTKNTKQSAFGISETYAKILAKQENYAKAIEVYKELSTKYPKKSANFASQIKKLKKYL